VGLGRLWPGAHLFADILLVPVVLYGLESSQRSAMLVGCAAGLLRDAWFQVGAFGVSGFKLTLLGWALGGAAARLDLNHPRGRFLAGAALSVGDQLLDLLLLPLVDQRPSFGGAVALVARIVTTGLLTTLAGSMLDRVRGARPARRPI
jgi:hypothetical protein